MLDFLRCFCLLLFLASTGCRDREEEFITESDLLGNWVVAEFDNTYHVTGNFAGQPLDERGESRISDSDLQMILLDNGRWQSTGTFTATVTAGEETRVRDLAGVGAGTWSFSQDTLYLTGLQTYNETGFFADRQAFVLNNFEKDRSLDFTTVMDATESDEDYDIEIRTRANYSVLFIR